MLRVVLSKQIQNQKFTAGLPLYSWQCRSLHWQEGHRWPLTCCSRTVVKMFPGDQLAWDAGEGNALAAAIAHLFERFGESSNL